MRREKMNVCERNDGKDNNSKLQPTQTQHESARRGDYNSLKMNNKKRSEKRKMRALEFQ